MKMDDLAGRKPPAKTQQPKNDLSLFDLFREPTDDDSVDVDDEDTAIIEMDELRKAERKPPR